MKWILVIITLAFSPLFSLAVPSQAKNDACAEQVVTNVRLKTVAFTRSCDQLSEKINQLKSNDQAGIKDARLALLKCREKYKSIEFFLDYYFKASAHDFNSPPKFSAEEPEDDYLPPVGFQQIEVLLFNKNVFAQKADLQQLSSSMTKSALNLPLLLTGFQTSDAQILRCLQVSLIRIMTLGITGYDAPLLKSGVTEAHISLDAIKTSLQPFFKQQPALKMEMLLTAGLSYLKTHPGFDYFDRMQFLKLYAMPLQQQLAQYIKQAKLNLNDKGILNIGAKNIFSPEALNGDIFLDFREKKPQLITLGKLLFFDKRLSGTVTRSCATCHQPERYFTDGLAKSATINGGGHVLRNAPTLLYAGFQYSHFWDARAKSLVEQVREVLLNRDEMAGNDSVILSRLSHDQKYITLFKAAFPDGDYQKISMYGIAEGLTAYVLSLSPRNSPFDKYMTGDKFALTRQQIHGFNLFMGKAQCGTCHFAPLFNGLIPPYYESTELEIIGVPKTDDRKHLSADDDEGSYRLNPVKYNRGAFKTPTVRNVAKTGPYMHNGSFHNLNTVMDFYNAGGGNGWGLNNPEQTLPSDSLKLNKGEINAIIGFLNSLTDKPLRTKKG